ncbi:MAG: peptide deformylase [Xenococcaceae cyanobacterium]
MSQILKIVRLGTPILRENAISIANISDDTIQYLIDNLIETAKAANGVGIAAPQVSQSHRLFIIASRPSPRYPNAPLMQPTAIINPRIVSHSGNIVKDWEGCLSIPGLRGLVPRSKTIEVKYTDRNGQLQRQVLTDFVARIFQHELDHLNGIVFLDRLESDEDLFTEEEYQEIINSQ